MRHALLLGAFALGDALGDDDDAAEGAILLAPRAHLPPEPVFGAIAADDAFFFTAHDGARECTAMDGFGVRADIEDEVVVTASFDCSLLQPVLDAPVAAREQVAHVAVEHRDSDRDVLDHLAHALVVAALAFLHLHARASAPSARFRRVPAGGAVGRWPARRGWTDRRDCAGASRRRRDARVRW